MGSTLLPKNLNHFMISKYTIFFHCKDFTVAVPLYWYTQYFIFLSYRTKYCWSSVRRRSSQNFGHEKTSQSSMTWEEKGKVLLWMALDFFSTKRVLEDPTKIAIWALLSRTSLDATQKVIFFSSRTKTRQINVTIAKTINFTSGVFSDKTKDAR